MMKSKVSLHRFGDNAGLSVRGNGETVYLTEKECREMARALYAVARSIRTESFALSTVGTLTVGTPKEGSE